MPQIRFHQSLRARILAFLGMLFLCLSILIVVSILIFVYTTEQNSWRERQSEAAANAASKVADYLKQNEELLSWLDRYEFDEIKNNPGILKEILLDNPAFLEITFVDKSGKPTLDAFRDQATLANQFTILQSEWFRTAISGKKVYTRVQTSPQNKSYIIFAIPSEHGGVLAAQIQMDTLWETVAQIHFGNTGLIYIVNETGQVIAHTDRQIVLSNQNIKETAQFKEILQSPGKKWMGDSINFDGSKVVSASAPISGTGWIVIAELPQSEAYAISRLAAILIPGGIIFLTIIATLLFRKVLIEQILQPLNLLREGARQIGWGNLDFRIEVPRMDEFGEVMLVFNNMTADLEKQQENLLKAIDYEYESQRARELDILLKASEATSSSLDFDTVMGCAGYLTHPPKFVK